MVYEQTELARLAVELCHREVALPQCGPSHGLDVDRVGLAALASGASVAGHESGRDTYHCLAGASRSDSRQRVTVRDENSRMPVLARPPLGATSGRGLAVVSAVAASWGTRQEGDGKVVWAEIGEPPQRADRAVEPG